MIVFDLRCANDHVFESWFGSSASYADQRDRGLIACPICGVCDVDKAVMAPAIGAKGNRACQPIDPRKAMLAALAKAQAKALEGSEYVGPAFSDRARAMHLGESPTAPIHGQASLEQARALVDEGVAIAPLPLPVVPPSARN
ncbi:DUF1178 family protein [Sphingomonas japonica]|uniref:DUF1178 family protein n=1 Tax=Sphingomonas japonica TaxID=511662 RepID=A0ABX0U172_9SPHN|nr:DUF1178 family protein [Sphingomonas japonica]NIJ24316.1 hypothetical protein [Sphingomonas japonica]